MCYPRQRDHVNRNLLVPLIKQMIRIIRFPPKSPGYAVLFFRDVSDLALSSITRLTMFRLACNVTTLNKIFRVQIFENQAREGVLLYRIQVVVPTSILYDLDKPLGHLNSSRYASPR